MFGSSDSSSIALARKLEAFAIGMFILFAATVLANMFPLRLLDAKWQIGLANVLVGNATIALVGLAFVHLAAYIDGDNGRLQLRKDAYARWAVLASLGYLLLIPLQPVAIWRDIQASSSLLQRQRRQVDRRFKELKESIASAPTTTELQSRLQALKAPKLPAAELVQPVSVARDRLLQQLNRSESRFRTQLKDPPNQAIWAVVQQSLRLMITALGFGMAFAAGAHRSGSPDSLLDELLWSLRMVPRVPRPRADDDQAYVSMISNTEEE